MVNESIHDLILSRHKTAKAACDALIAAFGKPDRMKVAPFTRDLKFVDQSVIEFIEQLESLVNKRAFYEGKLATSDVLAECFFSTLSKSESFSS